MKVRASTSDLSCWSLVTGHLSQFSSRLPLVTCHLPLLLLFLVAAPAVADELKLKDGKKISGNIVGFENGMFRVETEYGFVLVRKDKVSSVTMTAGETKKDSKNPEEHKTALVPAEEPASRKDDTSQPGREAPEHDAGSAAGSNATSTADVTSHPTQPAPPAPPPVPVSRPINEPLPAHISEHVEGNDYVNDTFHFVMYKPPTWKIYEDLQREKITAIVALSSEDEQTLLFVDRQVWSGEPDLKSDSLDAKLRQTYQDYKMLSESRTQIDGHPAIRRNFSGVIDGAEWYGTAVRVAQGSAVYGIIGMTSSESFQFQEAVFNKIMKSFHFVPPVSEAGAEPRSSPTASASR